MTLQYELMTLQYELMTLQYELTSCTYSILKAVFYDVLLFYSICIAYIFVRLNCLIVFFIYSNDRKGKFHFMHLL